MTFGEELFAAGVTDLVSIIPPGAALTPSSKIPQAAVGKVPGRRLPTGLYAGYDWRRHTPTLDEVRQWHIDGASLGIRADRFPGVDIDCVGAGIAQLVEDVAQRTLGPAPTRTGRPPKRLLVYRAAAPFGRMRLHFTTTDGSHLVEVLGAGQQYVIDGIHPGTMQPYTWAGSLLDPLTTITREQVRAFLVELASMIDLLAVGTTSIEGDGTITGRAAPLAQGDLAAPSLGLLRDAVAMIPNTNEIFPEREAHYLKLGYAIKAAAGEFESEGYEIFAAWAALWDGNDRHREGNDPEVVRADWRRMRPPYSVGWNFVAETARRFGFKDAPLDFDVVEAVPPTASDDAVMPPENSDQWLADRVVAARRGELRFVPLTGRYLVWDGARWRPDGICWPSRSSMKSCE